MPISTGLWMKLDTRVTVTDPVPFKMSFYMRVFIEYLIASGLDKRKSWIIGSYWTWVMNVERCLPVFAPQLQAYNVKQIEIIHINNKHILKYYKLSRCVLFSAAEFTTAQRIWRLDFLSICLLMAFSISRKFTKKRHWEMLLVFFLQMY